MYCKCEPEGNLDWSSSGDVGGGAGDLCKDCVNFRLGRFLSNLQSCEELLKALNSCHQASTMFVVIMTC